MKTKAHRCECCGKPLNNGESLCDGCIDYHIAHVWKEWEFPKLTKTKKRVISGSQVA